MDDSPSQSHFRETMKNLLTFLCSLTVTAATTHAGSLSEFRLTGDLSGGRASFTLEATANVEDPRGESLTILRGPVGLTEVPSNPKWRMEAGVDQLVIRFDRKGTFPFRLKFEGRVVQSNGWNQAEFSVARGTVQPIHLTGLA